MKKLTVLTVTVLLMAAMALTTTIAQQYVHTETLTEHENSDVVSVTFSASGAWFASGAWSAKHVYLWNGNTFDYRRKIDTAIYGNGVAIQEAWNAIYVAEEESGSNRRIRVVGYEGEDYGYLDSGGRVSRYCLALNPDETRLAGSIYSGSTYLIRIWDVNWDGANARSIVRTLSGHTGVVYSVAWSPDGRSLASASADGTVRLWNPSNGINFAVLRGHTKAVRSVAWSPDGLTLASGSEDNTIRLWNPDTNSTLRVLRGHTQSVLSIAFHPNGRTLASGSADNNIRLWNPNNGDHKATLRGHTNEVRSIAFHPNGRTLVSGAPRTIHIWSLLTVDVTGDGRVNFRDIVAVGNNYGKTVAGGANHRADVNNDGVVDIDDLIAVAKAVDAAAAPALAQEDIDTGRLRLADVREWLREAKESSADPAGIAALERLLAALTHVEAPPKETALLANYPNPFNPETWIPYQLAQSAEVEVSIHSSDGKLVRTLELGQLPAGAYQSRSRAAYWDGRNAQGEPVASGVYFYTLTAGDFKATRKMVIRK